MIAAISDLLKSAVEPPLLEGLRESPVRFAGHIGFFSQRPVEDLFVQGDSVALLGRSDELWVYTVSDDSAELDRPLPARPDGIVTEPLSLGDVDTMCTESKYRAYISPEYIAAAIPDGYCADRREDGRLIAYGATHDDLAIGNLHVLPQSRRRGYAAAIVVDIM